MSPRFYLLAALLVPVAVCSCTAFGPRPEFVPPAHVVAPPPAGQLKAPDGSATVEGAYAANVPAPLLAERGTVTLWFKPEKTLRGQSPELPLLAGDAMHARIRPRSHSIYILTDVGPAMTGPNADGKQAPYRYQALLTHLTGGQWYHAAWAWDADDASRCGFFLDGVRQGDTPTYNYPGQVVAATSEESMTVGTDGLTVSGLRFYQEVLSERQFQAICRAAGHQGYTDEGVRFTGQRFTPADVDRDHPVYETSFDDPSVLNDWHLEGGLRMSVVGGNLLLENGASEQRPPDRAGHMVCWLTREVPADFLLEFTVRPENRRRGLAIVFFNARGLGGENVFKPPIEPRNGTFRQYHSGDMNNYHISYWSGGRGTANIRKNKGFFLPAIGKDLVYTAPADAFQTIRIYKRGGRIRLTVDDVLALAYDDDGKTYGPVHTHSGWIGLRQMAHTQRCRYGHVRIYPLEP